jgi:hypothetical protein
MDSWQRIEEHRHTRLVRRLGRYVLAYHADRIRYDPRRMALSRYGFRDARGMWHGESTRHKAAQKLAEYLGLDEEHAEQMKSWQG